jgi:hypothetical protein
MFWEVYPPRYKGTQAEDAAVSAFIREQRNQLDDIEAAAWLLAFGLDAIC